MRHRTLLRYLARRSLLAVVLVFVVSSGAFMLVHLAPGDATTDLVRPGVSPATRQIEQTRLGLDRPVVVQYAEWLGRVMQLDLGQSTRYGRPVAELLGERSRNTALLAVSALSVATVVGLSLGVFSGSRGPGLVRALVGASSLLAVSVPPLLGSLLLALMAARTGWFPVGGMTSPGADRLGLLAQVGDVAVYLVLPTLALAVPLAATIERLQSRSLTETLRAPFVRAATARGLRWERVVWRHAFPVAVRPVVGVYGIIIGSLLSGSFVVEIVSAWPGLGRLMYEALVSRDPHLVAGCAMAGAMFLAVGNVASDALLFLTDPRLRTEA
jgi:peptide/nickel transport system permease protein